MSRYLFDSDEILCAAAARAFLSSGALAIAKWENGLSDDQVIIIKFEINLSLMLQHFSGKSTSAPSHMCARESELASANVHDW